MREEKQDLNCRPRLKGEPEHEPKQKFPENWDGGRWGCSACHITAEDDILPPTSLSGEADSGKGQLPHKETGIF